MKVIKILSVVFLLLFSVLLFTGCEKTPETKEDIKIVKDEEAHYLDFYEDGQFLLSLVVNEGETYDSLRPFFPTLTQKEGFIKYWDGDYEHTEYTKANPFVVWKKDVKTITINSILKKVE